MSDEDQTPAVIRGGLSSLAVRGLASGAGPDVTLTAPVASVLRGMTEPVLWVEISALTSEAVDAAHLYVHANGMFLLTPRAYGCYVIQGVRSGVTPADMLGSVAQGFLAGRRPAVVACRVEASAEEATVALTVAADGAAAVVVGDDSTPSPSFDDALGAFGRALANTSPLMRLPR
jgi:hypothetical protein